MIFSSLFLSSNCVYLLCQTAICETVQMGTREGSLVISISGPWIALPEGWTIFFQHQQSFNTFVIHFLSPTPLIMPSLLPGGLSTFSCFTSSQNVAANFCCFFLIMVICGVTFPPSVTRL